MSGRVWLALAVPFAITSTFGAARGEVAATPPGRMVADPSARAPERARREETLRALEQRARASAESRQRLEGEIAGIKADRAKLAGALVAAAHQARLAEERVRSIEARLDELLVSEAELRRSLDARRGLIAEVLAVLQRIGRRPPPAALFRADDLLEAIRAAGLLGSTMPALREETRRLSADLAELVRLRSAIAADRAALEAEFAVLALDRDRLSALIRARQERLASAEAESGRERSRSEALGAEARTLRELLDRMEAESETARRAAEEARKTAEADALQTRERFASAALRDPVRLAPRQPFVETRGFLALPAEGRALREFGAPDGSGGTFRGSVIGTRPRAVVTASADGTVVFAGLFRSYGRLLIINTGGGYYLLLAGMDQISVEVGQFVLAGEPVGQMGEVAALAAALGIVEADGPVLYVELRKDGGPIDPSPWWAKSQGERARG